MGLIKIDIDSVGFDKVLHFTVCYALTAAIAIIGKEWIGLGNAIALATVTTNIVALGKECYDKWIAHNSFDFNDYAADFLGMLYALLLLVWFVE